jgi:DNA polymerase-3 subunit gamma/tau
MVLVRLAHAADLPTPDEVIRALDDKAPPARAERNGGAPAAAAPIANPLRSEAARSVPRGPAAALTRPAGDPVARLSQAAPEAPPLAVGRFADLIELAAQKRDLGVKAALERDVRLVRCEDGRLEIALQPSATRTLVNDLSRKFSLWTGRRWMVVVSAESGEPTVHSQGEARQVELKTGVRTDPLVQAVLARFPGAEIVDVRQAGAAAAPPSRDPDVATPDPPPADDGAVYGADWQAGDMDDDS